MRISDLLRKRNRLAESIKRQQARLVALDRKIKRNREKGRQELPKTKSGNCSAHWISAWDRRRLMQKDLERNYGKVDPAHGVIRPEELRGYYQDLERYPPK